MDIERLPGEIPPWRGSPFIPGKTYRVRKSFSAMFGDFTVGELLVFVRDAWHRNDEVAGYFFADTAGRQRRWDIYDDDDLGVWAQLFELAEDVPPTDSN